MVSRFRRKILQTDSLIWCAKVHSFLVGPLMLQQNLSFSNPSQTSIHIIDNLELFWWNIKIHEEKSTRLSSILLMIPHLILRFDRSQVAINDNSKRLCKQHNKYGEDSTLRTLVSKSMSFYKKKINSFTVGFDLTSA